MQNVGTQRQHMEMCGNRDSVLSLCPQSGTQRQHVVRTKKGKECYWVLNNICVFERSMFIASDEPSIRPPQLHTSYPDVFNSVRKSINTILQPGLRAIKYRHYRTSIQNSGQKPSLCSDLLRNERSGVRMPMKV